MRLAMPKNAVMSQMSSSKNPWACSGAKSHKTRCRSVITASWSLVADLVGHQLNFLVDTQHCTTGRHAIKTLIGGTGDDHAPITLGH